MKLKCLVGVSSLLLLTPAHALTLTEAVDRALEFNPIVKSLEASVDVNKARLRQSYSDYQPAITWQAEKGKSRSTGSEWEDKTKSTVSLNQVVYDFGRISNTVDSRKHKLTAAEHTYKDGSEKLALLTTKAYLEILKLGACRTLGANEEEKGLNFEIFRIWLQQKLVLIFALLTQFQM